MSVLSISPFDTKSISELVVSALRKKGWAHLIPSVLSAKTVRRWDVDTWVGAFYFVTTEQDYTRVFFSALPDGSELTNFVSVEGGVATTSFPEGAWQISDLQGFSLKDALRSKAKLIVNFFNNPRVWDSIYYACSVGVEAERGGQDYLFYNLSAEKSLLNPRVIFQKSNFRPVKVDQSELLTAHVLRAAHFNVGGKEICEFMRRMLPVDTPVKKALFISLEAEKRVWVNQRDCLSKFIREAEPSRIVFNGMTAPVAGRSYCSFQEQEGHEQRLISDIMAASGWECEVVNTFGYTMHEKLHEIRKCSFFLTPGGSAFVLPSIMGIPGVISANTTMINWGRELDGDQVVRMPLGSIVDVPQEKGLYTYAWGGENESLSFQIDEGSFLDIALSHYRATVQ